MKVEAAYSFKVGLCGDPECRALHFNLETDAGVTFAVMTIGVEHVPIVIDKMRDLAYEITTRD